MHITSKRRLTIVVNQIIHEWFNNVLNYLQNRSSISIDISNTFTSIVKKQSSSSRNKSNEFIFSLKINNREYQRDMNRHFFRQNFLSNECSRKASITRRRENVSLFIDIKFTIELCKLFKRCKSTFKSLNNEQQYLNRSQIKKINNIKYLSQFEASKVEEKQ